MCVCFSFFTAIYKRYIEYHSIVVIGVFNDNDLFEDLKKIEENIL